MKLIKYMKSRHRFVHMLSAKELQVKIYEKFDNEAARARREADKKITNGELSNTCALTIGYLLICFSSCSCCLVVNFFSVFDLKLLVTQHVTNSVTLRILIEGRV